jgi:cold shock CspA family protein
MNAVRVFGTVRFFDHRGWGFIQPCDGSKDMFFNANALPGPRGKRSIEDGRAVSYEIGEHNGRATAIKIVPLESLPSSEDGGRGNEQ